MYICMYIYVRKKEKEIAFPTLKLNMNWFILLQSNVTHKHKD